MSMPVNGQGRCHHGGQVEMSAPAEKISLDIYPRIVLIDPVFQALGKQRRLRAIHPVNKALHPIPRESSRQS
jgi:hypothetical protein